jgi:PRTRC genetic system protein C
MAVVKLQRVFRLGATDFPDPDPELEPQQVLEHFATMYPQLRYGKVSEGEVEGDALVIKMQSSEFKPNG